MGFYRHVQKLFISEGWATNDAGSGRLRFVPLDRDGDDRGMEFMFWSVLHGRDPQATNARLIVEMSPDGEGWAQVSAVAPRELPYRIPMPYLLPYVRVRIAAQGEEVAGYSLLLCTAPFEMQNPRANVRVVPVNRPVRS